MSARPKGVLYVAPGDARPLRCERPILAPRVFDALVRGRDVAQLPALLGGLFTLCAELHRSTAQRAVESALGRLPSPERLAHDAELARASSLREHLTRLALELPVSAQLAGVTVDPRWLRGLPLADALHTLSPHALGAHVRALTGFVEAELLGPAHARLAESAEAVARWARERAPAHPVARWLTHAEPLARALPLSLSTLPLAQEPERGARWLASALVADPELALRPHWHGAAVATGPYSRARGPFLIETLWDVLAARIRDLVALCGPAPWLSVGALALGPGEGLAYTEMARGLLVHWVKLALSEGGATVAHYRVLSPTEWTFHPHGALARALQNERLSGEAVRLAVAAFDPCVAAEFR